MTFDFGKASKDRDVRVKEEDALSALVEHFFGEKWVDCGAELLRVMAERPCDRAWDLQLVPKYDVIDFRRQDGLQRGFVAFVRQQDDECPIGMVGLESARKNRGLVQIIVVAAREAD